MSGIFVDRTQDTWAALEHVLATVSNNSTDEVEETIWKNLKLMLTVFLEVHDQQLRLPRFPEAPQSERRDKNAQQKRFFFCFFFVC